MRKTRLQSVLVIAKWFGLVLLISYLNTNSAEALPNNQALPRYTPGVISIIQDHDYIQTHDAPTYWKISPFYLSQLTDASCSLAAATMVINALRIPQIQYANQKLTTANSVLHSAAHRWENDVKQGGDGVTLDQFVSLLKQAMKANHILPIKMEVIHVTKGKDVAKRFHQALVEGEKTGRTFIIVNFDQKFVSGTESAGHFAPVGAYDINKKRVLLMDPDRELFEPYWIPEQRLLDSMKTQDSEKNKNRGFLIIKRGVI